MDQTTKNNFEDFIWLCLTLSLSTLIGCVQHTILSNVPTASDLIHFNLFDLPTG